MIKQMINDFIASRFDQESFMTKKRVIYLLCFNILVLLLMPSYSLCTYYFLPDQFMVWLYTTLIPFMGACISLALLFKKKYMAGANVLTLSCFISSLTLIFGYANPESYKDGVLFGPVCIILLSFLFLNRILTTLYWIGYIFASVIFAVIVSRTGVALNSIIGTLGVYYLIFILVYILAMLMYNTFHSTNLYNQELLGKSEEDNVRLKELMEKSEADNVRLKELMEMSDADNRKLTTVIDRIRAHVDELSSTAEEMSQITAALSDGTQQQAANAEEISAALEEISAVAAQNMENSVETRTVASDSSSLAEEGSVAVKETVGAMKDIIDKIGIIDDIVVQTNLLSINAAIEASKAGTYGRGFSVVAREVKSLAEKSKESLKEIGKLSTSNIAIGERALGLFERIVPYAKNTAFRVENIANASEQQDMSVRQITIGIQQLSEIIQQNATASEQLSSTAERLTASALNLQEMVASAKMG